MKINSALQSLSVNSQQTTAANSMANFKKDFEAIGEALKSGDLAAAKKAYAQLQNDAPSKTDGSDPIGKMMEALSKAIDSGDLQSAQDQYAKIQEELSKKPPAGGQDGAGGAKGGGGPAGGPIEDVYDAKDTNKDGAVSAQEELVYDLKHPQASQNSSTTQTSASSSNTAVGESIDLQA
jgi:hypothetical protein